MTHSSIYPLTYSKEVYRAVGRVSIMSTKSEHFVKLINEANVLNFTVKANDPRSTAFIMHMDELSCAHNSDVEGHQIMMIAAAEQLEKREGKWDDNK